MKFEEIRQRALASWKNFTDSGRCRILIGMATCGRAAGAEEIYRVAAEWAETSMPGALISQTGCIGLCYSEPLVEVAMPGKPSILYGKVAPKEMSGILENLKLAEEPIPRNAIAVMDGERIGGVPEFSRHTMMLRQRRIVLRNCGRIDPENIDHYIAKGGYAALDRVFKMKPDEIIEEIKKSGLRGRGGAGFPTGVKWELCRREAGDMKYVICNADEGDPGAFMDRAVLESDPHAVIEGIAISAVAVGAREAYIYARAEYPLAVARLEKAIADAVAYGLLGEDMLGSGLSLTIHVMEGAGAFVCGEETALIASIEGLRGMPRTRPPYPAQSGLSGKPTNINNVETLANIPVILQRGADWFAGVGTKNSPGTKTFALAGKVQRTGLIEIPLGTTLKKIVFDVGGGAPRGRPVKAVQAGGPSGGCIPASLFDLPVDYESLAEVGSIMGSGGMVVMDDRTCMLEIARYFLEFTQQESCGKCAPCRLGTRQMLNILQRGVEGRAELGDVDLLREVARAVRVGSLCGLGQTAPNPALTTLHHFRAEYKAHIEDNRCPAGVCAALVEFLIDPCKCVCCGRCAGECPVQCISGKIGKAPARATDEDRRNKRAGEPFVINEKECVRCGACRIVCPADAVVAASPHKVEANE